MSSLNRSPSATLTVFFLQWLRCDLSSYIAIILNEVMRDKEFKTYDDLLMKLLTLKSLRLKNCNVITIKL